MWTSRRAPSLEGRDVCGWIARGQLQYWGVGDPWDSRVEHPESTPELEICVSLRDSRMKTLGFDICQAALWPRVGWHGMARGLSGPSAARPCALLAEQGLSIVCLLSELSSSTGS